MHAKKLISACTNNASGTHRALVGARSKFHLHIEQPAELAQHADTPSAQVQTLRASRSMRACCGLHAGVSACCAKSRTQAKRDPCARGWRVSIAASARGRYWRARLSLAALCYQLPPCPRESTCAARVGGAARLPRNHLRSRDSMYAARASNPRRAGQSTHPACFIVAWHLSESTAPVLFLSSCVLSSDDSAASARTHPSPAVPLVPFWKPMCVCVCLLLQDLLQSCSRGGEEESGRHVL
jgi:hypothetical protein